MGVLSCWSCQSPVAHSYGLLNLPNSFHTGMFKLNTKFDADSLLYSVILNVTATQYTCSLNGIYHPHWLVLWSCHHSLMCIPVHSPWLPGYMDIMQTILIISLQAMYNFKRYKKEAKFVDLWAKHQFLKKYSEHHCCEAENQKKFIFPWVRKMLKPSQLVQIGLCISRSDVACKLLNLQARQVLKITRLQ